MTNAPIALSLIICTRNRAQALRRCLKGIPADEMRRVSGELVLVDNGSADDTASVVTAFQRQSRFPVRLVLEPQPGLSRARNANGIARGAYYMKCILSGYASSPRQWLELWGHLVRPDVAGVEVWGALRYLLVRFMQRFQ